MIKKLVAYKKVNKNIATNALDKLSNHLWYLTPEASTFSCFDENVCHEVKTRMVNALSIVAGDAEQNRRFITDNIEGLADKDMDFSINQNSLQFFDRFGVEKEFLSCDVSTWYNNPHYSHSREIVKNLLVVNDVAERAVKLAQDYMNKLTINEDQKQYPVQNVKEYKTIYPNANKKDVCN